MPNPLIYIKNWPSRVAAIRTARTAYNPDDYEQIPLSRGMIFFGLTTLITVVIAALVLLISWLIAYCITESTAIDSMAILDRYLEAYVSRMSIALIPYVVLGLVGTALAVYAFGFINMWIFSARNKDGVPNNNRLRIWEWLWFQIILLIIMLLFYWLFEFAVNKFVAKIFISNEMNERLMFIDTFTAGFYKWMLNPGMLIGGISIISALIVGARFNSTRDQYIEIQEAEEAEDNARILSEAEEQAQEMIYEAEQEAQRIIAEAKEIAEDIKATP